jgi:RNA polymerase sigma-70 factor (ECF subfamily)
LPGFLEDGHHVEQFSEWALPAESKLLRLEARARVRAAIDVLPDSYRTVLLLRDIEEFSTEEAARALGVTPNTVKIRLHRARQALLKMLKPQMDASRTGTIGASC